MNIYRTINAQAERLYSQYKEHGNIIIAYDFDDTVYGHDGNNCDDVIRVLRCCKQANIGRFICYTASKEERYPFIEQYCKDMNLPLDKINDGFDDVNHVNGGKIYYNIFLDDKAGLGQALETLQIVLNRIIDNTDAF